LDHLIVDLGVPLTDAQWARIRPLFPDRTPQRGGRWRDHREVIDAIAFKSQTSTQWAHLPEKYGNCRPLAFVLTPGQAGDAPAFADVMARVHVPCRRGRPRSRPDVLLADKAYSSRASASICADVVSGAVIPVPADQ
jgi:hypothetical protein